MRRRLLIILIIAFICILAFVISGCSQLSSKESTVEKKFSAMVPELTIRYQKLSDAITVGKAVDGKRDVFADAKKPLEKFASAKKRKNVGEELDSARDLETIIGRLRANAASSPKLKASPQVAAAVSAIDAAIPGTIVRSAYSSSTKSYENKRTSWRYFISSIFGGYSAPRELEFSFPTSTKN